MLLTSRIGVETESPTYMFPANVEIAVCGGGYGCRLILLTKTCGVDTNALAITYPAESPFVETVFPTTKLNVDTRFCTKTESPTYILLAKVEIAVCGGGYVWLLILLTKSSGVDIICSPITYCAEIPLVLMTFCTSIANVETRFAATRVEHVRVENSSVEIVPRSGTATHWPKA